MSAQEPVNILLVDDQPAKLLAHEVILRDLGENLVKANSAREALEYLLKNDVAVVLMDVCMPDLDGFQLAAMLREHPRYERTAIIFISAIHLSDVDRVRGYETGAVDYVPVPVVPEILRAKVKIFVELYRKTKELQQLNNELESRVRERTAELEEFAARLAEREERFRLAGEAAEFGTYDYNAQDDRLQLSDQLMKLVELGDDQVMSLDSALKWVHPEDRTKVRSIMVSPKPMGEERHELEFRIIRKDGEMRWLMDRGQTFAEGMDGERRVVRAMGTVLDVTTRKQAEERQILLMAELDHRVKNILANVSAIARLSSSSAGSVDSFVKALDGRIQAMSRAHGLLRRGGWTGANLAELVAASLSPFRSRSEHNIVVEGAPLRLVPKIAQSLALVLHELATNAVKHGALSQPGGKVMVSWSRVADSDPPQLRFVWSERGGPPVREPDRRGFGLTVLAAAASEIGAKAECSFGEEGLTYTFVGPLDPQRKPTPPVPDRVAETKVEKAQPEAKPARILVVEDEPLVALQLQSDLESEGHHVVGPVFNLEQGMALARKEEIDAAFVDVSLGEDTSAQIADELLARQIPFVFATGYTDVLMLPEHLRTVPRLAKPYAKDDVRRVVEGFLTRTA
jgi:PAS domain S-box-containing protein